MNGSEAFGRTVPIWLQQDAVENRLPEHLDDVLRRTRTERQRSAWSSLERWLPMETTFAARLSPMRQQAWLFLVLALLVTAIVAVLLLAGSQRRVPPPFGPAANGAIYYADKGDIYSVNADGTNPRLVTGGPGQDVGVNSTRDGARIGIARRVADDRIELFAANADGSDLKLISQEPILDLTSADWSPDGTGTLIAYS